MKGLLLSVRATVKAASQILAVNFWDLIFSPNCAQGQNGFKAGRRATQRSQQEHKQWNVDPNTKKSATIEWMRKQKEVINPGLWLNN